MDPGLRELLRESEPEAELEVILKLRDGAVMPPRARPVARFGDIVTARVRQEHVRAVWDDPRVVSLKAPRLVVPGDRVDPPDGPGGDGESPATQGRTGRGTVVAVLDWGLDITHPNFRNADGSTRVLALWHQGLGDPRGGLAPYGYGRLFTRADIDAALAAVNPFEALGFHPAMSDPGDVEGTHGTHVTDIAAGNGALAGSRPGVAPQADIIFVHLATEGIDPTATLGDTVRILEALDFVRRTAGQRPWVANLSLGRHGGPHNGRTLVEQGIDALLLEAPGRCVVQSCGNYFSANAHAYGRLRPGRTRELRWRTFAADRTPNELEVWYSGADRFGAELTAPGGRGRWSVPLGGEVAIVIDGVTVGHAYHRAFDPAAGDHHVDIFLAPRAPDGEWRVSLQAVDVVDGRYHAWVERDAACTGCQSQLVARDTERRGTTGTICNGLRSIAVGAYDAASPRRSLARFSSCGPTRDGRMKPDICAPGVAIRAARSTAMSGDAPRLIAKSGTSMAAPHVTGTVACMFEAAGRPLKVEETRNLLLGSADPAALTGIDANRVGSGYLNTPRAIAAASALNTLREDTNMEKSTECESCGHTQEACECAECVAGRETLEAKLPENADDGESKPNMWYVLLSGGPGLFATGDVEHDQSWSNYVDPPLLLSKDKKFVHEKEQVRWYIYKPAYVRRWSDDTSSKATALQKEHVANVKSKKFTSYVDLLENRAKQRDWKLIWINSGADFYADLKTLPDFAVRRMTYWGHARNDLWLSLDHVSGVASEPEAAAVMKVADIDNGVDMKFALSATSRRCQFIGCNTTAFAKKFAKEIRVWTEGVDDKINFCTLPHTGGLPCLVGSAAVTGFDDKGAKLAAADIKTSWKVCKPKSCEGKDTESEDFFEDDESYDQPEWEPYPSDNELHDGSLHFASELVDTAEALAHADRHGGDDDAHAENVCATRFPWLAGGNAVQRLIADLAAGRYSRRFQVIGRPGTVLNATPKMGDVLLRLSPGEPHFASAAVIAEPQLLAAAHAGARGWNSERGGAGSYALVIERGANPHCRHDRFARRIVDPHGRVPHGQMLLRALRGDENIVEDDGSDETFAETPANVRLRVQNRLIRWDTVGSANVELVGTTVAGQANGNGAVTLNLDGVADGVYVLRITAPNVLAAGVAVGPAVGGTAQMPNRIWRPFEASVTVRAERIISTTSPDLVLGNPIVAKVQPVWMRSPNQSPRVAGGVTHAIAHIVVHHTSGPEIGPAINTFLESSEQRSAHYIIDTDGEVVKMVHEGNQSWHTGPARWRTSAHINATSIGIEIVNRSGPYTDAQYTSLIALLNALRAAHTGIRAHEIMGHSDISLLDTTPPRLGRKSTDPGENFEWERLERAGLGIIRSTTPVPATGVGLGGFFVLRPAGRLRQGDRDDQRRYGGRVENTLPGGIIADLQARLRCIGYHCPTNGRFDDVTGAAVWMFQEHFCGGTRRRASTYREVDLITAEALEQVVSGLGCVAGAMGAVARTAVRAVAGAVSGAVGAIAPPVGEAVIGGIDFCTVRNTLAQLARDEERAWTGPGGVKLRENNATMRPRLVSYWRSAGHNAASAAAQAGLSAADANGGAWSAAFISHIFASAGIGTAHGFMRSGRHLDFIVGALRNREASDQNRPFWLVDATELQNEATPRPGDLLCFNRQDENGVWSTHSYQSLRQTYFEDPTPPAVGGVSHTALIVGERTIGGNRFLETIGGNEGDGAAGPARGSVRLRFNIPINQHGHIDNPGANRIFGMIKMLGC